MSFVQYFDLATLGALFLLSVGCLFYLRGWKNKLPPGPRGIPFFGTYLVNKGPEVFEEWGKEYGDLMYIDAFGQGGILVVNSHTAAVDLFERRGTEYRHRPKFITINQFLTRGLFLSSTNDEELWRKTRRVSHESMSKSAVSKFWQIQHHEALILTDNILRDSTNWYEEVHRSTISGILSAVYDIPPRLSWDDPLVTKLNEFDKIVITAGFPGQYLVEKYTWMKYLPAAISPWKKRANKFFDDYSKLFMDLYREVEKKMEAGDEMPGVVGHSIRQKKRLGLTDLEASWIPPAFTNGGLATAESILWIFVAMIVFPDAQRKCQEELDAVVGRSRIPTFEDRNNLPYMRAAVRELFRWRATAPIGVPHYTKQDDWYNGYFIPKGTSCYGHIWMMNRDPKIYGEDVDAFNPDRFIGEDGQLLPAVPDTKDGHHTYGFGPRLCPGRHFSNDTLFITFVQLLWATTISPATEKTGKLFIPDPMHYLGTTKRPRPFPCTIKPRFPEAAEMVAQARELFD